MFILGSYKCLHNRANIIYNNKIYFYTRKTAFKENDKLNATHLTMLLVRRLEHKFSSTLHILLCVSRSHLCTVQWIRILFNQY